ncbi:Hypothetical protein PHPALM_37760 [Phytophthora palmivora]|uniref:Uncharacterized protein n=1 Tax=Phytophthora palmivora TaxID=4796 RepID=A0A2P4WWM5_9STRA|nr:Hypothetical protein PHPALM_37760 [Phytophthora palmivora]
MKLTKDELAGLPIISIILSGMNGDGTDDVQLDIPASKYLTLSDDGGSYYGNFHFSERSGGGASTMVGFDVIFDTENKRVGFAESDCVTYCSMLVGDDIEGRCKQRAFLDAAAHGDLAGVDAWLRTGGDVNVTMGEGWTALHYAVAHSRMDIVHRLLEGNNVDLNATTITGSSALTLAFARKSNTLVTLLLSNGASRSTISMELWQDLETATWIRAEVRRSLSSDYTVVWNPTLHRHFPPVEREKCRLVVQANVLALRQLVKPATKGTTSSSSSLTVVNWKEEIIQQFWWAVAALTESFREDELCVRWRYLAPPLVYHIIEYAVFLW